MKGTATVRAPIAPTTARRPMSAQGGGRDARRRRSRAAGGRGDCADCADDGAAHVRAGRRSGGSPGCAPIAPRVARRPRRRRRVRRPRRRRRACGAPRCLRVSRGSRHRSKGKKSRASTAPGGACAELAELGGDGKVALDDGVDGVDDAGCGKACVDDVPAEPVAGGVAEEEACRVEGPVAGRGEAGVLVGGDVGDGVCAECVGGVLVRVGGVHRVAGSPAVPRRASSGGRCRAGRGGWAMCTRHKGTDRRVVVQTASETHRCGSHKDAGETTEQDTQLTARQLHTQSPQRSLAKGCVMRCGVQ